MNTAQIDLSLRNLPLTKHIFAGTYARDTFKKCPRALHLPAAYVVNTQPSTEPGEHWVALFFPADIDNNHGQFFDSYGGPLPEDLLPITKRYGHIQPVQDNEGRCFQSLMTTVCGQYCMYFIAMRSLKRTYNDILADFHPQNLAWNDSMVARWVNKNFKIDTPTTDYKFLIQSCVTKKA